MTGETALVDAQNGGSGRLDRDPRRLLPGDAGPAAWAVRATFPPSAVSAGGQASPGPAERRRRDATQACMPITPSAIASAAIASGSIVRMHVNSARSRSRRSGCTAVATARQSRQSLLWFPGRCSSADAELVRVCCVGRRAPEPDSLHTRRQYTYTPRCRSRKLSCSMSVVGAPCRSRLG